jgi:1-acyl-sn-glycerol-3-phosphate acyltransferase
MDAFRGRSTLSNQKTDRMKYNHAFWERRRRFLRFLLRYLGFTLLVRLDRVEGLENIPAQGPAILLINHIAFVDPIVVLHVVPRNIVPMAKIEVYDYPLIGILPRWWGVIPVRREEVDRRAIQQALQVLEAGEIILVAPEGTRNPQLQRGKEGMAYLASRSGAPIIPVAIEGTEGFPALRFSRRWREPGVVIKIGKPFHYRPDLSRAGKEQLRQMADDAMLLLAGMLPEERRGVYRGRSLGEENTVAEAERSKLGEQTV